MKAALDAVGVENELIVVKRASHNLKGATPEDRRTAYQSAERWLIAHLSP